MSGRQQGFTLVEVLIAVAILAIALGAIITSVARATDNVSYMRDKTFAHWVAMNVITEVQVLRKFPSTGTDEGKQELGNHEWQWKMITTESPLSANMHQIVVEVRRDRKDKQPLVRLTAIAGKS
ncbi:MAG: type II secretion system minor pseudopilin GspI [Gammaproteobacteria bacterium]|nr:type II secretion system minor pseudopilin GspI [Gammaproteobacteria bacterium]